MYSFSNDPVEPLNSAIIAHQCRTQNADSQQATYALAALLHRRGKQSHRRLSRSYSPRRRCRVGAVIQQIARGIIAQTGDPIVLRVEIKTLITSTEIDPVIAVAFV